MKFCYLLILILLLSPIVTGCINQSNILSEENNDSESVSAESDSSESVSSAAAAINDTISDESINPNLPAIADTDTDTIAENVALPQPIVPEIEYIRYQSTEDYFELPLNGASGYAPISLNVRSESSSNSSLVMTLDPGSTFMIIEEIGEWWQVDVEGTGGFVYHPYCMINLPDVLPSVIYHNTNAISSVLKSSFTDIPNITGEQLYAAYSYNQRLGKDEFIMPVLYSTAHKIAHAQQLALAEGNTLIINELYRPHEVQQKIVSELSHLSHNNNEVLAGISASPWSIGWFIATGTSNHQRGIAIDTSLGKVLATTSGYSGIYEYTSIISYQEYAMQTPIHELSHRSASLAYPVSSGNDSDWRNAPDAENFTIESVLLRNYCTSAGLSPLASEWWHFNDLASAGNAQSGGDFYLSNNCSLEPIS